MIAIEGKVFNIQRYSIHDGPGIRSTVFMIGCPLNCWWCHNPESQSLKGRLMTSPNRCISCMACVKACTQGAIKETDGMIITDKNKCADCGNCTSVCHSEARQMSGKNMTVEEVVSEVLKDINFFEESGGGVTFSGGEPLYQIEFLMELLKEMGKYNIHTTIDTSGFTAKENLERASKYTDLFLFDLKFMDPIKHEKYTGVKNHLILDNLRLLHDMGKNIIIRIPVIPNVNDGEEDLEAFRDFIYTLPNIEEINLLPYHRIGEEKYNRLGMKYKLIGVKELNDDKINFAQKIMESTGKKVQIGG